METLGNGEPLDGIAEEHVTDPDTHWSVVPSVDENGNTVESPEEREAKRLEDPLRPGIKFTPPPETIG